MKPKRIKLVHVISSLKMGGAETLLVDLIAALGQELYEHSVLYFYEGPNVKRLKAAGVPVYHITGTVCLYDPVFWIRFYQCIKKIGPDLIHSHLWAANVAARFIGRWLGIPIINTIHAQLAHHGMVRNMIDTYSAQLVDRVVTVSPAIALSLTRWQLDDKVHCIANGIDVNNVKQRVQAQQISSNLFGWRKENIVIGAVGRFEPVKNFGTLIKAFARIHHDVPQARLLLIGTGSQEYALRNCAKQEGLDREVQFVIGQPAYGYYALLDIFVLPSYQEGLSIALLEAMSCALACISTGANGTHVAIDNFKNGIVVQPTIDALAEALMQFIVDTAMRNALGQAAQKTALSRFSHSKMVSSYQNLYSNLLSNRKLNQ